MRLRLELIENMWAVRNEQGTILKKFTTADEALAEFPRAGLAGFAEVRQVVKEMQEVINQ